MYDKQICFFFTSSFFDCLHRIQEDRNWNAHLRNWVIWLSAAQSSCWWGPRDTSSSQIHTREAHGEHCNKIKTFPSQPCTPLIKNVAKWSLELCLPLSKINTETFIRWPVYEVNFLKERSCFYPHPTGEFSSVVKLLRKHFWPCPCSIQKDRHKPENPVINVKPSFVLNIILNHFNFLTRSNPVFPSSVSTSYLNLPFLILERETRHTRSHHFSCSAPSTVAVDLFKWELVGWVRAKAHTFCAIITVSSHRSHFIS